MFPLRTHSFYTQLVEVLPSAENITTTKVAKAALAILIGVGIFCLFPWQIALPLTLTTYLIYKINLSLPEWQSYHFTPTQRVVRPVLYAQVKPTEPIYFRNTYPKKNTATYPPDPLQTQYPQEQIFKKPEPRVRRPTEHEAVGRGPTSRPFPRPSPTQTEREVVGKGDTRSF